MSESHPAATVVLLRDGPSGLETLLLRRNSRIAFGGMWVFPGGRVDEADRAGLAPDDDLGAAVQAATREAVEEAGLIVPPAGLIPFSHWTPPAAAPKRFLTWFFLAPAPDGAVVIDDGEIQAHTWMAPGEAITRRDALEIELAPPTWVTLHWLAAHPNVAAACALAAAAAPTYFATQIAFDGDGPVAIWEPDAAFGTGDLAIPGPRHRLCMRADGWCYERD